MTNRAERVMQLFDGELPPAEAEQVRALIASDPAARAEWERLGRLSGLVREVESSRYAAADSVDSILRFVDEQVGAPKPLAFAKRRRGAVPGFVAAGGVVVALAAGIALLLRPAPAPSPQAAAPSAAPAGHLASAASRLARTVEPHAGADLGVAIESVDFGSTQGAIFMVTEGSADTLVVWTLDDANDKG